MVMKKMKENLLRQSEAERDQENRCALWARTNFYLVSGNHIELYHHVRILKDLCYV